MRHEHPEERPAGLPEERLARLIDRALAEQAAPSAPPGLTARVLQAIESGSRRRWWERPLSSWPPAAQLLMFVTCMLCAAMLWLLAAHAGTDRPQALALPQPLARLAAMLAALARLPQLAAPLLRGRWVYEGAALLIAVYLTLFALLATAYALLWSPHARTGAHPSQRGVT